MIILRNTPTSNAALFFEVGGSIGMGISLVKKKLSFSYHFMGALRNAKNRIDFFLPTWYKR